MTTTNLSELPHDLQSMIAEEVWDESPGSLLALGSTCRTLRNACIPLLYRFLEIKVSTRAQLSADTGYLRDTPAGQCYLRYGRHIRLTGRMNAAPSEINDLQPDDAHNPEDSEDALPSTNRNLFKPGTVFDLEESLNPYFNEVFGSDPHLDGLESDIAAWRPFVDLIGNFERLCDIIWAAYKRFPPGLVEALHHHHPSCRIGLRRFRFLSLHDPVTSQEELSLINSPCLHSLSLLTVGRDSTGKDDHNEVAGMRVLTAAPRLRHFRILGARPASSPQLHRARGTPRSVWAGLRPDPPRAERSALETFATLCYSDTLTINRLDVLDRHMTFSSLRKASFSVVDSSVLTQLTDGDMLRQLNSLNITLKRKNHDDPFEAVAESFFSSLPGLINLNLSGTIHRQLLACVYQHHGPSLRSLSIRPWDDHYDMAGPPLVLQAEDFEGIARSCPQLKRVEVTLRRTMGDNRETRCYEAMSSLQGLTTATVHLDCSNIPDDPHRLGGGATTSQLKKALVNSAVDETLARSIWDIIAGGDAPSPLETLCITTSGGSSFGNSHPGDLMTIVSNISRSYAIKRNHHREGAVLDVVETSRERRERSDLQQRAHEKTMLEKWGHRGLRGAFDVMNQLWGLEEGYGNWREAWKSFPLQRSVEHADAP